MQARSNQTRGACGDRWPTRLDRGGEVLVLGTPDDAIQLIDVRDLARLQDGIRFFLILPTYLFGSSPNTASNFGLSTLTMFSSSSPMLAIPS